MAQGIFIGIGGSGVKSLARLKAKIYESYTDKEEFSKENSFIFIDTDINDHGKIQSDPELTRMYGGRQIIGLNEYIPIGATIPFNVRQNAITNKDESGSHLKTWMILQGEGKYVPKQNKLTDGAGARRMDGRTAIFKYGESHIIPAIQTAIKKMKTVQPDLGKLDLKDAANSDKFPSLWLISGSNGGTGSSMALDILFIMNRLYYQEFNSEPIVRLALLTPEPYGKLQQNRGLSQYPLNSFSFMWELNAMKMNEDREGLMSKLFVNHYFDNSNFNNRSPFKPYSYLLAFDTETTNNSTSLDISDTFENVAKVLFMLSRTPAGATINTDMSNYLGDNPQSFKPVNQGSLLDNTEWSKSIVATGGKAIEKPNADLKSYLKTRFLYDIFAYGILGPEFNEVHNDAEKAETVKKLINDNILLFLNNNLQVAEKPNLERDIVSALSNVIMSPEPAKATFGGYKEEGILSIFSQTFCGEVEEELNLFSQSFEKAGILVNSKEYYLNEIKGTIRKTLNNLVCEYGLNYVKGILYSIDFELEKNVLPGLDKTNSEEYSMDLEVELKSEIDKISSKNKDYAGLVVATEKWREFKMNKFIIQLKAKILLSLCKEGYFDSLLSANGNTKGLGQLITKFVVEKGILETEYLNLAKSFLSKSNENPFVTYFPPLSEMIGGTGSQSGWKRNSEFENLYSSMVSLNKDEKNIKGGDMMGTPPVRSKKSGKDKSLEFHLEELLKTMGEYNGSYFIDFAEQNDFDRGAKSVTSFMKTVDVYLDKKIIETKDVTDWLNNDLGQVFKLFEEKSKENKEIANSFKGRFNDIKVFYPNTSSVSSVYYIYNFPDELLELANSIGFEGTDKGESSNPKKYRNKTSDNNKLEVLAFETGHSFATYSYFKNYANYYQEKRKEILSLDLGCHIHKGFVHLDLDRVLNLISEKTRLIEVAFYDSFLEMIKEKNPAIFKQLLHIEENNDPFGTDEILSLPLIKIDSSTKTHTLSYNLIKFDSTLNKLKVEKGDSKPFNNPNYSGFIQSTAVLNSDFSEIIKELEMAFKKYKSIIGGELNTLITANFSTILLEVAKKICVPPVAEMELNDKELMRAIKEELNGLKAKNIFV
jgi:hypothetical protein